MNPIKGSHRYALVHLAALVIQSNLLSYLSVLSRYQRYYYNSRSWQKRTWLHLNHSSLAWCLSSHRLSLTAYTKIQGFALVWRRHHHSTFPSTDFGTKSTALREEGKTERDIVLKQGSRIHQNISVNIYFKPIHTLDRYRLPAQYYLHKNNAAYQKRKLKLALSLVVHYT